MLQNKKITVYVFQRLIHFCEKISKKKKKSSIFLLIIENNGIRLLQSQATSCCSSTLTFKISADCHVDGHLSNDTIDMRVFY